MFGNINDKILVGGLASLGGDLASVAGSLFSAHQASVDAKKIARENRKWMEKMSNTAHQREVKDLRAAGLNPILSVTGGSGASTPSASTAADIKTPDWSGLRDFGGDIFTALQVDSQLKKNEAEIANIDSSTEYNRLRSRHQEFENLISSAKASVASAKTKAEKNQAEGNARKVIAQAMQEELRAKALRDGDKAYLDKQERAKGRDPGNISFGNQYGQVSIPAWMLTDILDELSRIFPKKKKDSVRIVDPEGRPVKIRKSTPYPFPAKQPYDPYIYW